MAVSRLLPSGGANDFNLNVTGATTVAIFDKEYSGGSYSIVSSSSDPTTDVYAYNAAGTLVGYTSTKAFTASGGFNKIVVLGGTVGDVLGFTYKKTFATTTATSEVTAGPAIYSCTPTVLETQDDTTTITGANFATNVTVHFSGTGYASTAAKSVVRTNSTTLVVTRPDTFPASVGAYTITVSNPGVTNPVGSNAHILANAVTAGAAPVWVTTSPISFTLNTAWDGVSLSATDDSGVAPTYSVVSGTLPTGLSMSSSGVFTGTPTTSNMTVTIRATDNNGDTTDRAFRFNARPVWSSTSPLTAGQTNVAYSLQVTATDDVSVASYAVTSGSLPTGLSMTSGGLISGTPTVYANPGTAFTITATDSDGATSSRSFTLGVLTIQYASYTAGGTFTPAATQTVDYIIIAGGGSGGSRGGDWPGNGGGGAGGVLFGTQAVTAGTGYPITIGSAGAGGSGSYSANGGNSTAFGLTAVGGGGGGTPQLNNYRGYNGGSGGGSTYNQSGGSGTSGQGNDGGAGNQGNPASGGGGGGRGSAGSTWSNPVGGSGYTWIDGVTYAGGGAGGPADNNSGSRWSGGSGGGGGTTANATGYGSGGGAAAPNGSGSGSGGLVKIRYLG